MTVKSQSSIGSSYTFGQLITYGDPDTIRFDQLESAINALPAASVLQCLNHHTLFGGPANVVWPTTGSVNIGSNGNTAPVTGSLFPNPKEGTDTVVSGTLEREDCLLAQHAKNGFSFALFNPFGQLLHYYNEKMFVTRKQDGKLFMVGMKDPLNPAPTEETPLTDPLVTYLFTALDQGKNILPYGSNVPGQFQRSSYDLGEESTLQTSYTPIIQGSVLKGHIMGLSIKNPHDKKK